MSAAYLLSPSSCLFPQYHIISSYVDTQVAESSCIVLLNMRSGAVKVNGLFGHTIDPSAQSGGG